jgi:hypothetical protein
MPGIGPMALQSLTQRASQGDPGALDQLQQLGYDAQGNPLPPPGPPPGAMGGMPPGGPGGMPGGGGLPPGAGGMSPPGGMPPPQGLPPGPGGPGQAAMMSQALRGG